MQPYRPRVLLLVLPGIGLLVALMGLAAPADEPPPAERPRLAVLVVFDQMRGDYLSRWQKQFGKDGFSRLQREGAWFQNCHYPYAGTFTAPGHATLATGCLPCKHGIIANDWYDRGAGQVVSAVYTDLYQPVPTAKRGALGGAPVWRREPTVGEALQLATQGKARVVSLSIKDRAAILLAALRASLCAWFNSKSGSFVSSTYYGDQLPAWVTEFNRGEPARKWFGKDWTRFRPDLDYALLSGPDDVPAEGSGYKQGRTFPHATTGGLKEPGEDYYEAMANSPYGNELLLALARRAIDAEKLGQRDIPDLLCLSFTGNDYIGHTWGPDSQEVLDVTLHSDWIVQQLLDHLDARVGKGRYLLVLSADHGVCPLPEVSRAQGKDAERVPPELLTSRAEAFLNETFNKGDNKLSFVEESRNLMVYLNQGTLAELKLKPAQVEAALAGWLAKQPGVQAAYTRTWLSQKSLKEDAIGESVRQSFDPERSGDVMVVLKPYHLLSAPITSKKLDTYRTTHGTPHSYDTHVPLLVYGPGVRPGIRQERVTPLAAATILAHGLGIRPPLSADTAVPDGLLQAERK